MLLFLTHSTAIKAQLWDRNHIWINDSPPLCCAACCTEQWLHWTIHRISFTFSKVQPHLGGVMPVLPACPLPWAAEHCSWHHSFIWGAKAVKRILWCVSRLSPCKMNPKPPFFKQITWLNCPWLGSHICFRIVFSQIKGGRNSSKEGKESKKRKNRKKLYGSNKLVASAYQLLYSISSVWNRL